MRDNSGNVRINRKHLENRRRKQLGSWLFLIVFITLLAMLVSSIRNMKAEMEEMQAILKPNRGLAFRKRTGISPISSMGHPMGIFTLWE